MDNLALRIKTLFPNADMTIDVVVQDDGEGAFIKQWNLAQPQPTEVELLAVILTDGSKDAMLERGRVIREVALGRLGGIAGRASRSGDTATAAACDVASLSLLAITDAPTVIAATNGAETQYALTMEWRNIATTLGASAPSAVTVFEGLGL